jgi:hypothetical protein
MKLFIVFVCFIVQEIARDAALLGKQPPPKVSEVLRTWCVEIGCTVCS